MGKKITLELPEESSLDERELILTLAAHLYGDGRLSLGQAADLAGMDKVSFIGILADYKVSIFNSPVETIIQDMRNA